MSNANSGSTLTQVKVVQPSTRIWCSSRDTIAASSRGVVAKRNVGNDKGISNLIEEIIEPLHFLGAFVGYRTPKYNTLARVSLCLFVLNLITYAVFNIYFSAINLYLSVFCVVAVAYTMSAGLSAYYVVTRTLPYVEKAVKNLYRDKLYIDSLESIKILNQKYMFAIPLLALLLAVFEFICHIISGLNVLSNVKQHIGLGIIIPINFLRFVALFHQTFAYCFFMACAVTLMALTGLSMRQWTEQAGSVLRVSPPEISFGEAVYSFGLRSSFVSEASKACEGMLTVTFLTGASSIILNSYSFLFTERCGVYLWYVIVSLSQIIIPLAVSAWATKAYHDYTLIVVQAWVTQPDDDELDEFSKQKGGQGDSPRKKTWKDVLRKSTKIVPSVRTSKNSLDDKSPTNSSPSSPQPTRSQKLSTLSGSFSGKDSTLKVEPTLVRAASDATSLNNNSTEGASGNTEVKKRNPWKALGASFKRQENVDDPEAKEETAIAKNDNHSANTDDSNSKTQDTEKKVKEKNNQFINLIRGVGIVAGKLQRKRNQQRLNFEKYITYLQSCKPETGFSVMRSVMTWGGVSNFVFLVFSAVAVFAQEAIFGDASSRKVGTCLNKTIVLLQNL